MSEQPRLLFLSQTLPFPPDGGVKIRTYHTLRNLATKFDITALCFYRWKKGSHEPDVEKAIAELQQFARVQAFPIPQEHSRARFILDHLRSVLLRRVYTVYSYESRDFSRALVNELRGDRVVLVHLDSLDLSSYLPLTEGIRTVCVHHDAQSLLLERRSGHQRSGIVSRYLKCQANLMAKEERNICPRVDLNVTVSEKDAQTLKNVAPTSRFRVVPNGVDIEYFRPCPGEESGLVFVGGTSWYPNKDALHYYQSTILPEIRAKQPTTKTVWVGRASAEEVREYSSLANGLQLTGYVSDVRPFIASAACYVVPIRIGGGTRIKILDAWAMGKAVVSTSIGCEGLDARDGENILIADTPAEFAEKVHHVLCEPELRSRLGDQARRTVEQSYSWNAIGAAMNAAYLNLVDMPQASGHGNHSP